MIVTAYLIGYACVIVGGAYFLARYFDGGPSD